MRGVRVKAGDAIADIDAGAVVLACGGFEANLEWRTRYLGPNWDFVKVRGTRFNTGDGLRMALEIGAAPYGNWGGCHAVGWDSNAPEFGDLAVGSGYQRLQICPKFNFAVRCKPCERLELANSPGSCFTSDYILPR